MADGPQDPAARATRGRRRPELLEQTEVPEMPMDGEGNMTEADGEFQPEELPALFPGDIIMARASVQLPVAGAESWFSYGVQSRLQPGETEEESFWRLGSVVNTRVLDLAAAAETEILSELERRKVAARNRRIN